MQTTHLLLSTISLIRAIYATAATLLPVSLMAQLVVLDPTGDSSGNHDLTSFSGGFDAGNIFLGATFSPGTLDQATISFLFGLDTDLNAETGVGEPFNFPAGAEFQIFFNSLYSSSQARVFDSALHLVGTVPISFTPDSFGLALPLSMIGNEDGIANFGIAVGITDGPDRQVIFDVGPDNAGIDRLLAGPTVLVPEPSTFVLLAVASLGLTMAVRGRNR